jgi:AmmeMemoRadiSam system protein B
VTTAVQPTNVAGTWYPADPDELRETVEQFLGETRQSDPDLRAIIVPHAGYRYSGKTAGAAYARLGAGCWKRAVILAPSHYQTFPGAALFPGSGLATPLGVARIDTVAAARLFESAVVQPVTEPFSREHSVEMQLPFLQVVDPALRVVPLLIGATNDSEVLGEIAAALDGLDDGETLFVVSSDFTHYGARFDYRPFPPRSEQTVAAELRRLDFGAIEPIARGDGEAFREYVETTGITICGRGPIACLLALAESLAGELLSYHTSLEQTGDYEHSVSYVAMGFRPAIRMAA